MPIMQKKNVNNVYKYYSFETFTKNLESICNFPNEHNEIFLGIRRNIRTYSNFIMNRNLRPSHDSLASYAGSIVYYVSTDCLYPKSGILYCLYGKTKRITSSFIEVTEENCCGRYPINKNEWKVILVLIKNGGVVRANDGNIKPIHGLLSKGILVPVFLQDKRKFQKRKNWTR